MSKKVYYIYNPDTDNFERAYPTLLQRMKRFLAFISVSIIIAAAIFVVAYYGFTSPSERELRRENSRLMAQCTILGRRLENALKVMDDIRERDDNFYRVMMQMEPVSRSQRMAGLENESRYRELSDLSDAKLVTRLSQNMDLLERQLFAQTQSFDELYSNIGSQKDKLDHTPSVSPIRYRDFTLAAGFGHRRDPMLGYSRFHEGLDMDAREGTQVRATADGTVSMAERKSVFGNCVEIDHGYQYQTRFAHLKDIKVKPGQDVRRGDVIGTVGSTGRSSGPHLHYEVRFKDVAENPVNYFFMDLSPEQFDNMLNLAENAGKLMD